MIISVTNGEREKESKQEQRKMRQCDRKGIASPLCITLNYLLNVVHNYDLCLPEVNFIVFIFNYIRIFLRNCSMQSIYCCQNISFFFSYLKILGRLLLLYESLI